LEKEVNFLQEDGIEKKEDFVVIQAINLLLLNGKAGEFLWLRFACFLPQVLWNMPPGNQLGFYKSNFR
jgi:hypothetical protein